MRRQVDRESYAHDYGNHRNRVQVDAPEAHVAKNTQIDADYGDGDDQSAGDARDKQRSHDPHANNSDGYVAQGAGEDHTVLIDELKEPLVDADAEL